MSASYISVSQNGGDNEASRTDAVLSNDSVHSFPQALGLPSVSYQPGRVTSASITNGLNSETLGPFAHVPEKDDASHPQYATYPPGDNEAAWNTVECSNIKVHKITKGWVPWPLRAWFWIPLVIFMILTAIGLEIALYYSNKYEGWATSSTQANSFVFSKYLHFSYTSVPVIYSMVIVALWAWTDLEIRRMQPYIDLVHGNASPEKSLLLDYTTSNKFLVWIFACGNSHYMVAATAVIAILALVFNPLGAAMLVIRPTWWGPDPFHVTNLAAVGLNNNALEVVDLTVYLSAAGYASSSVLYELGDPPFIHDVYAIGPFIIPTPLGKNGTVTTNTTAVRTDTNCHLMDTASTEDPGGGWTNHATYNGCTYSYSVNKTTNHLFGADVMTDCLNTGIPDFFRPVVLWFFTYDTTPPQGSATFCAPSISLWDVSVSIDVATSNLTSVQEIRPFNPDTSPFASLSGTITGPPMNGQAYNGIRFNITTQDPFILSRSAAVDLQLPSSIFQAASTASGNLTAAFQENSFVGLATKVYGVYLNLVASKVYFLSTEQPLLVQAENFQQRLWLSDIAVHVGAVILLVVALIGTLVQICHRASRQQLNLRHVPGTLASAISIGADTNLTKLFNGPQQEDDFTEALRNRKFRIDPQTMRIVLQGDEGYEEAVTPNPRHSIFASWGLRRSPSDVKA